MFPCCMMRVSVPVLHLLWLLLAWQLVCTAQRTPRSCSRSPVPAAAAGCSAAQCLLSNVACDLKVCSTMSSGCICCSRKRFCWMWVFPSMSLNHRMDCQRSLATLNAGCSAFAKRMLACSTCTSAIQLVFHKTVPAVWQWSCSRRLSCH